MKKIFLIMAAMLSFVLACNKEQEFNENTTCPDGHISVSLSDSQSGKAGLEPYIATLAYEEAIQNVQLLIFDKSSGKIIKQEEFTDSFTSMKVDIVPGTYTVYAAVNAPTINGISKIADLSNPDCAVLNLSSNSVSGSRFLMCGSEDCTVTASVTSSCVIPISRLVSRVALKSIDFKLPDGYIFERLNCVFLGNVQGQLTVDGKEFSYNYSEVEPPFWYNMGGMNCSRVLSEGLVYSSPDRKPVTGASTAELPELTCFEPDADQWDAMESGANMYTTYVDSHPVLLYGFPNSSTVKPLVSNVWKAQKTTLVLYCKIKDPLNVSANYYYVIPIDKLERNKTYTYSLTIASLGSDNPNKLVEKGGINASLIVSGWESGGVISSTI